MFISNYDKEQMRAAIRTLQLQMVHVMDELKALNAEKATKVVRLKKSHIFRTDEAPWGYKKNGEPKKRPGPNSIHPSEVKNES